MNEIKINLDNLTEDERKQFEDLVKKGNKLRVVKPPVKGRFYYYLNSIDGICECVWHDDDFDLALWKRGNVFLMRESAEYAKIKKRMRTRWERLSIEAGEGDNPWDDKHQHHFIAYNHLEHTVYCEYVIGVKDESIYFPTKTSLEAAIAELGLENVKRYILEVKE